MLFILVGIGLDSYAIPARDVLEIAPGSASTSISGSPHSVIGLIQYRGRTMPLLDLGKLCKGAAYTDAPAARILIVESKRSRGANGLLGIRAERATSTVRLDESAFGLPGINAAPYVTGVTVDGRGAIVQRLDLHRLLDENATELFAEERIGG
jgi:chemotaxis signal transduction protein